MRKQKPSKQKTRAEKRKERLLLCFDFLFALENHLWHTRDSFRSSVKVWDPTMMSVDRALSDYLYAAHVMRDVLKNFEQEKPFHSFENFHLRRAGWRLCAVRDCGREWKAVDMCVVQIFKTGTVKYTAFTVSLFETSDFFKETKPP